MRLTIPSLPFFGFLIVQATTLALSAGTFKNAHDDPPPGWTGHVFTLSQNYPATKPVKVAPWKAFDFQTQPEQYIRAVLAYALDGNITVNWDVDQNTVRKWFHAPWLHSGNNGREFVRGMTHERTSQPGELHPSQTSSFQNWAVGMYNPMGGYILGKVWNAPAGPDATKAKFPDGTVAIKLLFTTATVAQVPFLHDSLEWQADINRDPQNLATLRLLQKSILSETHSASRALRCQFEAGDAGKAELARLLRRHTPMSRQWIADRLHIGSASYVSHLVKQP